MDIAKESFVGLADSEVWSLFKKSNINALDFIYKKFYNELYHYGMYFTNDDNIVKDGIQNIFSYIYEKREKLGDTNNIKYYLFLCLKREILQKTNKTFNTNNFNIVDPTPSVQHELEKKETDIVIDNELMSALDKLSASQKEIIYLSYYKKMSADEVAKLLSITARTVYNQTYMAIQKLKNILA